MIRTRLVVAALVVGTVGLIQMSWGQGDLAPSATPAVAPRAGGGTPAIVVAPGAGNPATIHVLGSSGDTNVHQQLGDKVQELNKESDSTKKAALEKEIKTGLGKLFDARQAAREEELKRLEQRVKELRELFDKRQKAKDEIVENRFQQLIRASNGLDWGEGDDFGAGTRALGIPVPVPANRTNGSVYQSR